MALEKHQKAIEFFGKKFVEPYIYPVTRRGFQDYRIDSGIKYVTTSEMIDPHRRELAASMGHFLFLPQDRTWWPRGIAVAALIDKIRGDIVGAPVYVRNWLRPSDYNKAVHGEPGSDHLTAHAMDVDSRIQTTILTTAHHRKVLIGSSVLS